MSRNGAGVYSLPAPPSPLVNGQTVDATNLMTMFTDIATAMTGSVAADGQTPMSGPLNMNSQNITTVNIISAASVVAAGIATSGGVTVGDALVVTKGGLTVSAGGAAVTGNSTITGTLTVTSTLIVGGGPTWTVGTGAPVSTQPLGSMFSRTDGGVGTTLYVSQGAGTWNPVAGV